LLAVTTLAFGLLVALVYISMIVNLGIHDLASLRAWIVSSTHGVSPDVLSRRSSAWCSLLHETS